MDPPRTQKPARGVWISLSEPTLVFVTVTSNHRARWVAQDAVQQTLLTAWSEAEAWIVGRYVLMPNHLHFFCTPRHPEGLSLNRWMSYWKGRFTTIAANPAWSWQSLHWDHRLRSDERYAAKWQYAVNNPVRAGLVAKSEDWPWQGEVNSLEWHE